MERPVSHLLNPGIRPAAPEEAQLLGDLALRAKAMWGYSTDFIEACRKELTYSSHHIRSAEMSFAVAESDGLVVGFYAMQLHSKLEVELDALFVDPDWTARGIGRRLVEHAVRCAAARGATAITIQADPNALGFYLAAGASVTGQRESASIPGRYLPTLRLTTNTRLFMQTPAPVG